MIIRDVMPADINAIRAVETAAFGRPGEATLVDRLRIDGDTLVELVAIEGEAVIGHVLFSRLGIGLSQGAALAPMAVMPNRQRSGVGSALVRAGISRCREMHLPAVLVLGHAGYYPRFGFSDALASALDAPFAGPSFMGLELVPGALAAGGHVRYAPAFGL